MKKFMKYFWLTLILTVCGVFQVGIASASTFTATGDVTGSIPITPGEVVSWTASTDNSSSEIVIEASPSPLVGGWVTYETITTESQSGTFENIGPKQYFRARCSDFRTGATMVGTVSPEDKTLDIWQDNEGTTVFEIKESGITTAVVEDGSLVPADTAVAEGNVIVGNSSAVGVVLDASGDTKILIGNGTTITSVVLSGDVTMANTGAVTIAAGAVEGSMIAAATVGLSNMATDAQYAQVRTLRVRATVAEVNAGIELLAAVTGSQYQLVNVRAIAVGGAVGTVTTIDILGTQSAGSVKLVAFAQASLTQSAVLTAGGTGAAVLADGASFALNDVTTAITAGITDSDADTATHIDFIIEYVIYTAA